MVKNMPESLEIAYKTYKTSLRLSRAIAENISSRRKELGMTQARLAELTDKKQPDIARLERSNYGRHTINSLNKLAVALETTVSELTKIN